jgi:hypothetical protein
MRMMCRKVSRARVEERSDETRARWHQGEEAIVSPS